MNKFTKPMLHEKLLGKKKLSKKIIHSGKFCIGVQNLDLNLDSFASFTYTPDFLSSSDCEFIEENLTQIPFVQVTYEKFGKVKVTPRKSFCYGSPFELDSDEKVYWRNVAFNPEPMPDWLQDLRKRVEKNSGKTFNAVIISEYPDSENYYIGRHADDETFLQHRTIASLSFGMTRPFYLYLSDDTHQISLERGSLLLMHNGLEHSLPKKSGKNKIVGTRWNITFRCLKPNNLSKDSSGYGNYYYYNRGQAYSLV